jgi:hypothetical protein
MKVTPEMVKAAVQAYDEKFYQDVPFPERVKNMLERVLQDTPEQSDYDTAYQNGRQEAWDELRRAAIAHGGVSNTDTGETIALDKTKGMMLEPEEEALVVKCEQTWEGWDGYYPSRVLKILRKYFPKPHNVEELEMIVRTTDPRSYAFEQALWSLIELAKKNNVA